MTDQPTSRRADAARNRELILAAARAVFAATQDDVSMAEVARRSGVGSATLYRNFANRRELLEALYVDEVDAVCAAASTVAGETAGERFTAWLERFLDYFLSKRHVAAELLKHAERTSPVFVASRDRVVAAGEPLLAAAQQAGQIVSDLSLDQILDMLVAVAGVAREPAYVEPMVAATLAGLRRGPAG